MKNRSVILLFLFFPLCLFGQSVRFNNTYHWNNSEASTNIFQSGSGYVVIGPAQDSASGNSGVGFLFIDSIGNQIGKKTFGRISEQFNVPYSIKTTDSCYIVTGQHIDLSSFSPDAYLIKFNQYGDTLWTKIYRDTMYQVSYACQQSNDKGFILIGYGDTLLSSSTITQFLLIKTDSLGDILWKKLIGISNPNFGFGVNTVNDGGYVFTGGRGNPTEPIIFKTDSLGNVLWTRVVPCIRNGSVGSIKQTLDGGFLTTGFISDTGNNSWNFNMSLLVKLFSDGTVDWSKKDYTKNLTSIADCFYDFVQLQDSSYIVVGSMMNDTAVHYLDMDGVIYHISKSGNELWNRRYDKTSGFNKGESFNDLVKTNDGGYAVCGSFAQPQYDFWVVKVDSLGCDSAGCEFVGIDEKSIYEKQELEILIYPNPVSDEFKIQINSDKATGKIIEFSLIDITGRKVFQKSNLFNSQAEKINVSEFNNGIYFYSISGRCNFLKRGKLIIAH